MNWFVFGIAAWVLLGMHTGLGEVLALGDTTITPLFPVILVVFVAMWAPLGPALGAALIVGLLLDIVDVRPGPVSTSVTVIGPNALGLLLAAYTIVLSRALLFRRNVLTLVALALLGAALSAIVVTALLSVRSFYDEQLLFDRPIRELGTHLARAAYTAAAAFVVGPVLLFLRPLFHFPAQSGRGAFRMP